MNELAELVKNYNSFINDLELLNNDLSEILNTYNLKYKFEFWWPRDKVHWSNKKTFAAKYQNENEVFYIGFNLESEEPYLLLERMYDLINCKPDEFNCDNHCFDYVNDNNIVKIADSQTCGTYKTEWGKGIYAKIPLIQITSQDVVTTDIKAIIEHIINNTSFSLKYVSIML